MAKEYIERRTAIKSLKGWDSESAFILKQIPAADVVEVDKVAEMLQNLFVYDCACNYNGLDEWLPTKCKYAETECPMPKERLGCWKEFVKHYLAKMYGERRTEND